MTKCFSFFYAETGSSHASGDRALSPGDDEQDDEMIEGMPPRKKVMTMHSEILVLRKGYQRANTNDILIPMHIVLDINMSTCYHRITKCRNRTVGGRGRGLKNRRGREEMGRTELRATTCRYKK